MKTNALLTIGELAEGLNRSVQYVGKERKRHGDAWPVTMTPDGERFDLEAVKAFRRRSVRMRKPQDAAMTLMQWAASEANSWAFTDGFEELSGRGWLADKFTGFTAGDLEALAELATYAVAMALEEAAGGKVPEKATPDEYRKIFSRVNEDALWRSFDLVTVVWSSQRFGVGKFLRPAKRKRAK